MIQEKVATNKQLVFTLIVAYILIALAFVYFSFFPMLINPLFNDILIVLGVLLLLSSLIYASIKAKSSREVILVLSGITLLSILARSIPHLRLPYPTLKDPYLYFISARNILDYGTLQPVLGYMYTGVTTHLHWPIIHLITAISAQVTAIDSMWFFRFQQPLLGAVFTLAVFAFAREATKNNSVALISALLASMSGAVIFYQAEYHPQGLALIFFVLFLYSYLKSRTTAGYAYRVVALIFLGVLVLSHHFSSLFIALLATGVIGLSYLIRILPWQTARRTQAISEVQADHSLWMIVAVVGLAYHLFVYFSPVYGFLRLLVELPPLASPLVAFAPSVPLFTSVVNSAKWGIFLLAVFSVIKTIRAPIPHELRLLLLLVSILFAGVLGNYVVFAPLDRLIAFYDPVVAVFAAMTVHRLFMLNKVSIGRTQVVKAVTVFIVGLLLTAGFLSAHIPAFYFKTSQINPYYWYYNRLPAMEQHKAAGEWLGEHTAKESRYGAEWDTNLIVFFYGWRPLKNIHYFSAPHGFDYILVNPAIKYERAKYDKSQFDQDMSRIYTNGELVVYSELK